MAKSYGNGSKYFQANRKPSKKRRLWFDLSDTEISAISAGNIAEGFGRKHTKDKLIFYYDSRGSLSETKSHLIYGHRIKYFSQIDFDNIVKNIEDVWKELNYLIHSLYKRT